MLKLVSWIDSLPRLAGRRKNSRGEQRQTQQKRRFELKSRTKSIGDNGRIESTKKNKKTSATDSTKPSQIRMESKLMKAIGRRRHTEPDAFQCSTSPVPTPVLSPMVFVSSAEEGDFQMDPAVSFSWHPENVERVQSLRTNYRKTGDHQHFPNLINSYQVSYSVQEINNEISTDQIGSNYMTQSLCRPKIRTNPWVKPKSPRILPALDLSQSGNHSASKDEKQNCETDDPSSKLEETRTGRDHSSVFSLRSSSGYGSGASQDSSPASSVHTPDWQNLSVRCCGDSTNSNNVERANRSGDPQVLSKPSEDIGLQCDLTEDKSVECTEDDFLPFYDKDENGNIPMIDEDSTGECEDCDRGHICSSRCENRLSVASIKSIIALDLKSGLLDDENEIRFLGELRNWEKSNDVLNVLNSKVEMLKATGDQVTRAVRSAKEEQKRRNGELRAYEEQMQFLKHLKLVISNGFEVMV